jgi:murein DD-endopeptidase MepM/ murein hydrolase activator NlpD
VASNESALIPTTDQLQGHQWHTRERPTSRWNTADVLTPPATGQPPPTKGAVDGWDTAEWNMRYNQVPRPPAPHANGNPEFLTGSAAAPGRDSPVGEADWPYSRDSTAGSADGGNLARPTSTWTHSPDAGPARGRHRVAKQRTRPRGSVVFGVAAAAVLGVGGVASAQGRSPVTLSLPDLPKVADMPGIGTIVADVTGDSTSTETSFDSGAGEALRTRILDQANQQRNAANEAKRDTAAAAAAKEAAAKKVRAEAAAKKKAAAEAEKRRAAAEAARLAKSFVKPVSSYTLTAGFGQSSSLWASTHTGQDFAAPTGTPVSAIHGGSITSAGWAGSYGYRIIETLGDGTEIWYCHLSSMTVTSGKVTTGETIGRVGATGNTTGPHLHLEVRPGGGDPIDPNPWLRARGLDI